MTRRSQSRAHEHRNAHALATAYPSPRARRLSKLRTMTEAAEMLQVSRRTVQRLIRAKKLRAHHIGALVRIEDDAIAALLDATESM